MRGSSDLVGRKTNQPAHVGDAGGRRRRSLERPRRLKIVVLRRGARRAESTIYSLEYGRIMAGKRLSRSETRGGAQQAGRHRAPTMCDGASSSSRDPHHRRPPAATSGGQPYGMDARTSLKTALAFGRLRLHRRRRYCEEEFRTALRQGTRALLRRSPCARRCSSQRRGKPSKNLEGPRSTTEHSKVTCPNEDIDALARSGVSARVPK